MRVLLVTEEHEPRGGGLTTAVQQLARHVAGAGDETTILCTGREPLAAPDGARLIQCEPSALGRRWGWNSRLFPTIKAHLAGRGVDLVHVHGVWQAAHWYAARRARAEGIPLVFSAHGMLEPYHWSDRGRGQLLMKRTYWALLAYPVLRHANVIHAITPNEARNLRRLFPTGTVHLIPNAVDLEEIDRDLLEVGWAGGFAREPTIAFLGRFHPKKGLDILIDAFSQAELPPSWRLKIAGPPGVPEYMARVETALSRSAKRDRIDLVGPIFGSDKWRFLRTAGVLAVPSLSEAIGLVNLEAAACGTPSITTRATGLEDWEDGGGILVSPEVGALRAGLERVSRLSPQEYAERSRASRALVERRYSWGVIGNRWRDVYARARANGTGPAGRSGQPSGSIES